MGLCLDTGHVAYTHGDAPRLIREHADRIWYVHLKAVDPDVLAQVEAERLSFADAVRRDVMCEPGLDETIAGVAAGRRLAAAGKKTVLCVLHAQGQVQLEDRCAGVKQAWGSEGTMTKLYVNDESPSDELSTMTAALTRDKTVDAVITLDAQVALNALQAMQAAHSRAKLYTFDTNAQSIAKIKSGAIQWAVDQQPYLQGYESVDSLWLYLTNGNVLGGGQVVLTGPSFVDASNVDAVAKYAARGTR